MKHSDFFLCDPGLEAAATAELNVHFSQCEIKSLAPGVLATSNVPTVMAPACAFVRQALLHCEPISAPSISAWARSAAEFLLQKLDASSEPWRLHFVSLSSEPVHRRAELINSAVREQLQRRRKRLLKTLHAGDELRVADEYVAQVGLLSKDAGVCSIQRLPASEIEHLISRYEAGIVWVPADAAPPSRAYRKLVEAQLRAGRRIAPGETCVDLGASPGGWTAIAVRQGACVTAVDRSPLRADLMQDPLVRFVKGDGFAFKPEAQVDWLLCDIIAFPERSVELIECWLSQGWCRNLCVTLKFRGEIDLSVIAHARAVLSRHARFYFLKQLSNNKNEVTAWAEL